jgi:hypothetical protein
MKETVEEIEKRIRREFASKGGKTAWANMSAKEKIAKIDKMVAGQKKVKKED